MSVATSPIPTIPVPVRKLTKYSMFRFIVPLLRAVRGDFKPLGNLLTKAPDAFCVNTPINRIVFLNAPELVEELLVVQYKDYHKDPGYASLRRLMGNGLITNEDEHHLKQRRMIQPAFHKKRIDEYGDCMVDFARKRSDRWQDGATMEVNAEMMAVTLSIISKTMFDADVDDQTEVVYEALNTLIGHVERYVNERVGKIFDALPLPSTRRIHAAEAKLDEIMYRFIREHRESGRDHGDLLSMLLLAQGEDGSAMSEKQVRDECITLFLAGHETTSLALTWTWYLLSQNPEVEARLHEELDRVLEGGRAATAADVPNLEYTRRVMTESMRVLPPVPVFGRQAVRDTTLGSYQILNGDTVNISPFALHMRETWFPDPERFDPDRWLPERCSGIPKFAYFPFGGGVRKCIGEPFAWMEGILLIAAFAQRWRFELAPDARIGYEPKITMRPKYGMRMILHKR